MILSAPLDIGRQMFRALFAPHNYLIFFVTARCNARCPFCFYWREVDAAGGRSELSLEEIRAFTEKAGHLLYLSIGGGEPTLRDDLPEIAALFYRNCGTRFINLTTNGLRPAAAASAVERILSACPNAVVKVNLSVDAWGDRHDAVRAHPGAFRRVEETYRALRDLRGRTRYFAVNAATTLSRRNESDVLDLIDRVAAAWDVNDHTVTYVRGDPRDPDSKGASIEIYEAAVRRLEEVRGRSIPPVYRLLRALARTTFRVNIEILRTGRAVVPCVAGRRMITLSDDGTVKACEVLEAKEGTSRYDFGRLRDHDLDLARVRATPAARAAVRFIRESECRCTFECANMANVALAPRAWPLVLREVFRSSR